MKPAEKFDEPVDPRSDDDISVVSAIMQMKYESADARDTRLMRNRENRDAFLGRQDFSHKIPGQSREFLPKVGVAVEQMVAFIKRGLTQFGDWFSVDMDRRLEVLIDPVQIQALVRVFMDNLWLPNGQTQAFPTVMSDTVKNGLLESLMILKVHGSMTKTRKFIAERGDLQLKDSGAVHRGPAKLNTVEMDEWRLRIDTVKPEDYYPDPTGNGLYEIHVVERDLHEVLEMAEEGGIYDAAAVQMLVDEDYTRPDDEARLPEAQDQPETTSPAFRKRVVLAEFWGTILGSDGTVAHRNCVACVANGKYLIRPPEPNPFWHQESPFCVAPLIRVPWSVWHKALFDNASKLNLALNEMFNLILDGGLSSVWGIKQIRLEDLEDPGQVAGGIAQGVTLAVKSTLPHGNTVLETVAKGEVPSDAMAVFEFLNREFNASALTNEVRLGSLPGSGTTATAVTEANQSQAVTLDGLVMDLEHTLMTPVVRKSFLTIMQNADHIPDAIMGKLDPKIALLIMRSDPAERFALFAGRTKFTVNGLSSTMARAKDFQKIMAMMQACTANPLLMQAFMKKFSPERVLRTMMKCLNINPDTIEKDTQELAALAKDMQELPGVAALTQGGAGPQGGRAGRSGPGLSAESVGDPGLASQVNQEQTPMTGMT